MPMQAYLPKASEACEKAVMSLYPNYRPFAKSLPAATKCIWAKVIDVVHKLEADTEAPLE